MKRDSKKTERVSGYLKSRPFQKMPKDTFHLPIETAVIVPSTNIDKKIPKKQFNRRVKETRRFLSDLLGGYTSVSTVGGFVDDDNGKLIEEKGVKVTSFGERKSYIEHNKEYRDWLLKKQEDWNQKSIGYEYEGDLYYLKQPKKAKKK